MSGGGDCAPGLSARGSRIAGGARGLLDKGFDMYIADPFDRDRNPQVGGEGPRGACARAWREGGGPRARLRPPAGPALGLLRPPQHHPPLARV